MTEEPYRWLEAIGNRREYVREQLKGGSPVFGVSLREGVLLLGVGAGQSKIFEVFDRQAMAGLGHPADLERIRQAAIDGAHLEAFTRAPEDVNLRRLVGYLLSPQIKTNFEQLFTSPYLIELLFAEVGKAPEEDVLMRLHFDGALQGQAGSVAVAAPNAESEMTACAWLKERLEQIDDDRGRAADLCLQAWWCLMHEESFDQQPPEAEARQTGWRQAIAGKAVEAAWLARTEVRRARFEVLTLKQLGL